MGLLRLHRLHRGEKGAHIIELALMLPLYFLLILVIFDLSRIITTYTGVTVAARKGAREGSIPDLRELIPGSGPGQRPEFQAITNHMAGSPACPFGPWAGNCATVPVNNTPDDGFIFFENAGNPLVYTLLGNDVIQFEGETRSPITDYYRAELRSMAIANMTMREIVGPWSYPCFPSDLVPQAAGCPQSGQGDVWTCYTVRGSDSFSQGMSNAAGRNALRLLGIRCDAYVTMYSSRLLFGFGPQYFRLSSSSLENVAYLPGFMYSVN